MGSAASKRRSSPAQAATEKPASSRRPKRPEEQGIVLGREEEAELERALAEADEDERAGRVYTLDQVLAGLRRT